MSHCFCRYCGDITYRPLHPLDQPRPAMCDDCADIAAKIQAEIEQFVRSYPVTHAIEDYAQNIIADAIARGDWRKP